MQWLGTILVVAARLPLVWALVVLILVGALLVGVGCAGALLKLPFGGDSVRECAELIRALGGMVLTPGDAGAIVPHVTGPSSITN